ncbi:MAG: hypothetical protein A2Z37_02710 [Chloroflexi bacterium RBG_19FT_COMBO_62_14]|nr:MAG: hypothetical protein A2Z37_02710 [Chloroflexi bacterium RBG_19FT_COMBO_62_14]
MEIVGRFFNQHSFTLFAATSIVVLAIVLFRDGIEAGDLFALGALSVGLLVAYIFLQPGPSSLSEVEHVEAQIGNGRPVLLEFQSPY